MTQIYTLANFTSITFQGFNYTINPNTLDIISKLATQVGSPTYIKSPNFQKVAITDKKQKANDNWESLRSFHTTKIEKTVGIDNDINQIIGFLNKLSDKTYIDIRDKIMGSIEILIANDTCSEDMQKVGKTIFEIASNNKFYSKLYATLYSDLILKFDIMREVFDTNYKTYMQIFNNITYVSPDVNYNEFCRINKINEERKAISAFILNLSANNIIPSSDIEKIVENLLTIVLTLLDNATNKIVIDEMTENIFILYNKSFLNNKMITETIHKLALSSVKTHQGLSSKSIFKYMDIVEL